MTNTQQETGWNVIFEQIGYESGSLDLVFGKSAVYEVPTYKATTPLYNGWYYRNPIVVDTVAKKAQRVSEGSIGDEEHQHSTRPRFSQKSLNTFDYTAQLEKGLKDEAKAFQRLQELFPDFSVKQGPKFGHDAEMIHRETGATHRVEIKTCSFIHKTSQLFDELYTENQNGIHSGGSEKALKDGCALFAVQSLHTGQLYFFDAQNVFDVRTRLLKEAEPNIIEVRGKSGAISKGITIWINELEQIQDVPAYLNSRN